MNDRELLELAAKAVGIELYWEKEMTNAGDIFTPHLKINGTWGHGQWNPLVNDGDALRLAVKLSLHVKVCARMVLVEQRRLGDDVTERLSPDPLAATRRAIVRAAHEIGRSMP